MLKNIPKILSPDLLKILCEMGHGDELVIADGNFPAESCGQRVVRADGHGGAKMLEAVLSMIPLDTYAKENFVLMQVVEGDNVRPTIWEEYKKIAAAKDPNVRAGFEERFAFYERAKKAYAIVATGEEAVYANIILKKGVIQ
ncbi:MAG TPA: L-fucose mutarotase [Candidatus Borkfalkia faecipullorum]|uniref:L-fucose mutarotase n=1 Tax=Candidatus Borkfalkia faecipullorum TaxID=2838510 RepID=A0A9D2AFY6_9FIRM|nr:L-fucose mutarotase [Candidatus Borkfalkia faecipullorum]